MLLGVPATSSLFTLLVFVGALAARAVVVPLCCYPPVRVCVQDSDLFGGTTGACSTYGNPCLSSRMDFECMSLEVWAFKPRGF